MKSKTKPMSETARVWQRFATETLPGMRELTADITANPLILKDPAVVSAVARALNITVAVQSVFRKMPVALHVEFAATFTTLLQALGITHDAPAPAEAP